MRLKPCLWNCPCVCKQMSFVFIQFLLKRPTAVDHLIWTPLFAFLWNAVEVLVSLVWLIFSVVKASLSSLSETGFTLCPWGVWTFSRYSWMKSIPAKSLIGMPHICTPSIGINSAKFPHLCSLITWSFQMKRFLFFILVNIRMRERYVGKQHLSPMTPTTDAQCFHVHIILNSSHELFRLEGSFFFHKRCGQ